jgi:hypothetical protein
LRGDPTMLSMPRHEDDRAKFQIAQEQTFRSNKTNMRTGQEACLLGRFNDRVSGDDITSLYSSNQWPLKCV